MRNLMLVLLFCPLLFTSCFVTRYTSNENELKKQFANATVDDVKFNLGEPDEITETTTGYVYLYNSQGRVWKSKKMVDQYIRVSFNEEHRVSSLQSTTTRKTKRFSVGKTIGLGVALPIGLVAAMAIAGAALAE
ncbi:hypothetical protein LJC35_05740 [Parabacteroides sp. OttesenSCG-928-N08]|nr:hypothetical protein [Parabacteroides sp. OttesenSCG-928-N08]